MKRKKKDPPIESQRKAKPETMKRLKMIIIFVGFRCGPELASRERCRGWVSNDYTERSRCESKRKRTVNNSNGAWDYNKFTEQKVIRLYDVFVVETVARKKRNNMLTKQRGRRGIASDPQNKAAVCNILQQMWWGCTTGWYKPEERSREREQERRSEPL